MTSLESQLQGWKDRAANYEDRIAELEAHAEHDEDNLAGLERALVRTNQRYTQAEAAVAELQHRLDDRTERVKQAIERSCVTAVSPHEVLSLIDRIADRQDDEKRDAYLAAKYKWQREIQVVGALDYNGAIARLDELWESHLREQPTARLAKYEADHSRHYPRTMGA